MAIRNSNLGGTNWSDGEVLYSQDLNDTMDALFLNGTVANIKYASGTSTTYTPLSASNAILIFAKGHVSFYNKGIGTVYLKVDGNTKDDVDFGDDYGYSQSSDSHAFPFSLIWAGNLSASQHTILIDKNFGTLNKVKILIIEIRNRTVT